MFCDRSRRPYWGRMIEVNRHGRNDDLFLSLVYSPPQRMRGPWRIIRVRTLGKSITQRMGRLDYSPCHWCDKILQWDGVGHWHRRDGHTLDRRA